jgi:hypothetical protein
MLMTKDIFIFYLTLIFFPFQEKPAKERIMLSVIIKTKKVISEYCRILNTLHRSRLYVALVVRVVDWKETIVIA